MFTGFIYISVCVFVYLFLFHLLDQGIRKAQLRSSLVTGLAQMFSPSPTGVKEHIGSERTWLYSPGNLHLACLSQGCCRQLALVSIGRFKSFSGSMCTNQSLLVRNQRLLVTVLCIKRTLPQLKNTGFCLICSHLKLKYYQW